MSNFDIRKQNIVLMTKRNLDRNDFFSLKNVNNYDAKVGHLFGKLKVHFSSFFK